MRTLICVLIALIGLVNVECYQLLLNGQKSELSEKTEVQSVEQLLKYNMGVYSEQLSTSDVQVLQHFGVKVPSQQAKVTLVVDLLTSTTTTTSNVYPSCQLPTSLISLLSPLSPLQSQQLQFDLCNLHHFVQSLQQNRLINHIHLPYVSTLYLSNKSLALQLLYHQLSSLPIQVLINTHQSFHSFRMLQTQSNTIVGDLVIDPINFQVYVWFPVVLAFVLFFAILALYQMDFSNDTILYAKFITADKN